MNKRTNKTSNHFARWATIVFLVLVLGGGVAYYYHDHHTKKVASSNTVNLVNTINYSPSTSQDNANNTRKDNGLVTQTLNSPSSTNSTTTSPTNTQGITVTITRASISSNNLQVATLIGNASAGTCTLTLSQNGQESITQTESVQQQTNSYICPVYSVPLSNFPNQGQWNVSVSVTDNGSTATGIWQDNPISL
jgi:hypothetical protein